MPPINDNSAIGLIIIKVSRSNWKTPRKFIFIQHSESSKTIENKIILSFELIWYCILREKMGDVYVC